MRYNLRYKELSSSSRWRATAAPSFENYFCLAHMRLLWHSRGGVLLYPPQEQKKEEACVAPRQGCVKLNTPTDLVTDIVSDKLEGLRIMCKLNDRDINAHIHSEPLGELRIINVKKTSKAKKFIPSLSLAQCSCFIAQRKDLFWLFACLIRWKIFVEKWSSVWTALNLLEWALARVCGCQSI